METNLNNQIVKQEFSIELEKNPIGSITASHALVTNIELPNGKTNSIVTIFNSHEFSFEELSIGITSALYRGASFDEYTSRQSTLYSINDGKLKKAAGFPKVYNNKKNAS